MEKGNSFRDYQRCELILTFIKKIYLLHEIQDRLLLKAILSFISVLPILSNKYIKPQRTFKEQKRWSRRIVK